MLAKRIVTAVVALIIVLSAIFYFPQHVTLVLLGVIMCAGAWEWAAIARFPGLPAALSYSAVIAIAITLVWFAVHQYPELLHAIYWIALAFWVIAFLLILRFPVPFSRAAGLSAGLFMLVPAYLAMANIYVGENGPARLLLVLVIVWAADVGAYFAGRRFGRRKLAPTVSPGKSWEGVFGGLLLVALVAVVGAQLTGIDLSLLLPLSLLVAAVSVVGDLTVSMFKRNADIKDSGRLFPGHGGVMDRIDSICAATPLFALALSMAAG